MEDILKYVLPSIPGILGGLGILWFGLRKQHRYDQTTTSKLSIEERGDVVRHLYDVIEERREAHKRDIKRLDEQVGHALKEAQASRNARERCEIVNARLIEFLRVRDMLSESQIHEINRPSEEWETERERKKGEEDDSSY